eukprot:209732-Rhodomonas_salina.1
MLHLRGARYPSTPVPRAVNATSPPVVPLSIRDLSTVHRIAPYAISVPRTAYHHTQYQYPTVHRIAPYAI